MDPAKVSETHDADIHPNALSMRPVDFRPRRRRQALHAVVARSQKHRTHDVDEEVNTHVEPDRRVTVTPKQNPPAGVVRRFGGDDSDHEAEPEDGEGGNTAQQDTTPPSFWQLEEPNHADKKSDL